MATVLTNRLMADDPAIIIAQAEAQRGPIVAGWIRRGVRRIPWPRRDGGLVSGPGLRGSGLVRMLPLGAGYLLSYLFCNVNGLIAPDTIFCNVNGLIAPDTMISLRMSIAMDRRLITEDPRWQQS